MQQGPGWTSHVIADAADALVAGQAAMDMAEIAGFGHTEAQELRIVARELATNIVKYAGRGQMRFHAEGPRLTIEASDNGPGIANVDLALTDGFSTGGSLGYGLGTVNRIMDDLVITSVRGEGTTVTAHRSARASDPGIGGCDFDIGVATQPKPGQVENGDGYVIRRWGSGTLVAVIDGVGHGAPAKAAAQAAARYVDTHYDQPLEAVFKGTDIACRGTRGVVMAIARFDCAARTVEFASIGNIEARVLGARVAETLIVRRGILGTGAPRPKVAHTPWPEQATLVLFSDGVASHWGDGAALPAGEGTSSLVLARTLLARHSRQTDDATVLVVQPRAG